MLDDLALFVCIVQSTSLQAAAHKLAMPPATLTRRLQKLERQLGCRLLHRSARRLVPTGEGWQYYERCRPLLASLQDATASLDAELHHPRGMVRVLAPVTLASVLLRDAWASFMTRYPDVRLELRLANAREDLSEQGADLALRVGDLKDAQLGQRHLGWGHTVLVASPDYLARHAPASTPDDLASHALLVAEPMHHWRLTCQHTGASQVFLPTDSVRLRVNDMALAVEMAIAGQGILYCPRRAALTGLQSGQLVSALAGWQGSALPIHALWQPQRTLPARVRVLLTHLRTFMAEAEGDAGMTPPAH